MKPISFTRFCDQMRVGLEPGQRILALVAFDGLEPCELSGQDRELARLIFGPSVDTVPDIARRCIGIVCGGRSGKTYIFIAMRMLHLALTVDLSDLAPGEVASANITAPDLDLARQALNYAVGAAKANPRVAELIVPSPADELRIDRGSDVVSIKCRAAAARGKTGRGRSLVGFGLDECALFYDADHRINDEEVFKANNPRVIAGGQGVIASTPWAQSGLIYRSWKDNWNKPTTMLVAHAPTRTMRIAPHILAMVDAEYRRDFDNAEREFGAKFMSGDSRQFFDEECLISSTSDNIAPLSPGDHVFAGVDAGFTKNSSALVVAARTGSKTRIIRIAEWKPINGVPLRPSLVFEEMAAILHPLGVQAVMADPHYKETAREDLGKSGISVVSAPDKSTAHARVKRQLKEGNLILPDDQLLLKQLREITSRPLSGGSISIFSPVAADGRHGDIASAAVLALFQAYGVEVQAASPEVGSIEYLKKIEKQLEDDDERYHNKSFRKERWRRLTR